MYIEAKSRKKRNESSSLTKQRKGSVFQNRFAKPPPKPALSVSPTKRNETDKKKLGLVSLSKRNRNERKLWPPLKRNKQKPPKKAKLKSLVSFYFYKIRFDSNPTIDYSS